METDMISVIIPVYNTAKYVGKCIESIINQSYKNLEILIIDDASTDSSFDICKDYADTDKRIKIIRNDRNIGLSGSRNIGIDISKGKYIAFVDSDDYIIRKYIETLYFNIKKYKADVSQCMFYEVDDMDVVRKKYGDIKVDIKVFNGRDMIKNIYNGMCLPTTLSWTKLYKRKLFFTKVDYCLKDNEEGYIRYPVGRIHEDEAVSYKIFDISKSVVHTSERLYCYRYVKNSITHRKYSYERLDNIKHIEERLRIFKNRGDNGLYYLTLRRYYYELDYALRNCKKYIDNSMDMQEKLIKKMLVTLRKLQHVGKFEDKSWIRTRLILMKCRMISRMDNLGDMEESKDKSEDKSKQ